jgi:hypothetical protein
MTFYALFKNDYSEPGQKATPATPKLCISSGSGSPFSILNTFFSDIRTARGLKYPASELKYRQRHPIKLFIYTRNRYRY